MILFFHLQFLLNLQLHQKVGSCLLIVTSVIYSIISEIIPSSSSFTWVINGGMKSLVAFCSGHWILLVKPLKVIFIPNLSYSATSFFTVKEFFGICINPVSFIRALSFFMVAFSNSLSMSGSGLPSIVTLYLTFPSF